MPDESQLRDIPLFLFEENSKVKAIRPATNQEKIEAFRNVKAVESGLKALDYDPIKNGFKNYRLKPEGVEQLFDEDLKLNSAKIKNYLPDLEKKPAPLQMFNLDMQYNMGSKYNRNKWARLFGAYDANDRKAMARESHRRDVQESRNQAAYDLLINSKTIQQILGER